MNNAGAVEIPQFNKVFQASWSILKIKKVAPPFLCPLTDMWTLLRLMLLIKTVGVERMNPFWPIFREYHITLTAF